MTITIESILKDEAFCESLMWLKEPFIEGLTKEEIATCTPYTLWQVESMLPKLYAIYGHLRDEQHDNNR